VEQIHHAKIKGWSQYRRFIAMLIFRSHCKREVFQEQIPLLKEEAFWKDPVKACGSGSRMEKMLRQLRKSGKPLQTSSFLIIPERLVKDDDENLVQNLLARTRRLIKLAQELWPIVNNPGHKSPEELFKILKEKIKQVRGCGKTWIKMLTVEIAIAKPQLCLLENICEVGAGAVNPLQEFQQAKELEEGRGRQISTSLKPEDALVQVRDWINESKCASAKQFWALLALTETKGRKHFKHLPLIAAQMKTRPRQLSCATLQVQFCEFRQFENFIGKSMIANHPARNGRST